MSAQVLSLTLNPAIDHTVHLARLRPGTVHRAASARHDAGGKGINVAACLADWGVATAALGVLGIPQAGLFEALFQERGIADHCLRVEGDTRTNIKLVDDEQAETTDINLPGPALAPSLLSTVAERLASLLRPGLPVVLSGSLPAGLAADAWARLQAQAGAAGGRVLLDTSGAPLAAALAAPRDALPYLVKPNRSELEAWAGQPLLGRGAVLDAARALLARGIAQVVVSMGSEGALFADASGQALLARPPRLARGSSVGAGDAMVAGLAAALLEPVHDLETSARLATAFSLSRLESGHRRRIDPAQVRALIPAVDIEML